MTFHVPSERVTASEVVWDLQIIEMDVSLPFILIYYYLLPFFFEYLCERKSISKPVAMDVSVVLFLVSARCLPFLTYHFVSTKINAVRVLSRNTFFTIIDNIS